jgi:glutathione S-transferase
VLLYDSAVSGNCSKVRLLLAHLGLPYERRPVDVIDRSARLEQARRAGGYAALDAMERHLADRRFLVGEQYTIADVSLYAYTHVAGEGGFDLAPYPAIRGWLDRVRAQPGHVGVDA